ncbi:LysR family transcriptional regulator [Phyllobacterium salinisoli]|uniref:LysR family transcriptional regulator n=1 Tax=Phyllobacterium salinisoli TaxID=1899321 RepID=A0A368JXK2_9HYPH|nr:NAD(P)H-binding protein [Phyllobacterium salinisoli]RCS21889.1 LysR family transcriptional regulator [Phyllobacterium salinisoli]
MKITVMGASGLIGTRLTERLRHAGMQVVPASVSLGVNSVTGEGLKEAVSGADVVIDVTNAASFGDDSALTFFKASTRNLLAASAEASVNHYLALSVVGTPRLVESDYFRAKMVQENLIRASRRPYTILRSTQFFEFISGMINMGALGDGFRLPPAFIRPISADDVSGILAELALGAARNNTVEIGGPEPFGLDEIARMQLAANEDKRQVISDSKAPYYGVELNDDTLLPHRSARMASQRYLDWLIQTRAG